MVETKFNSIACSEVRKSDYQDRNGNDVFYGILKQVKTTEYTSNGGNHSKQHNPFASQMATSNGTYDSTRVAFLQVPEGTTAEQVAEACANGHIYTEYSFNVADVLTDNQLYAVSQGQQTLADYEKRLVVKGKDDKPVIDKIAKREFYSQSFYWGNEKSDNDMRDYSAVETPSPVDVVVD